jgi:sugar phosphate isomerase/epimerase
VAVCERVNSPRVKLLYDIYHMQIMEGDIIRTIRDNIGWIGHFHTAGNPGRFDLDDAHGGGEGKTGEGRAPVDPWGNLTKGYRTRNNRRTQSMIVSRRKK